MWSGFRKSCLGGSRKRRSDEASQSGSDAETLTGASAAETQTHRVEEELQPATPAAAGAPRAGNRAPCQPGQIEAPTPTSQAGSSQPSAGSRTKEKKGRGTNLPSASTHDDPANRIRLSPSLTGAFIVETPTPKIKQSSDVSQEITSIMKGRYKFYGPWPHYDDMLLPPPPGYDPETMRDDTRFPAPGDGDASWLEFQRKFTWSAADSDRIENIYQNKARLNFNNMLNHAKKQREKALEQGKTPKVPGWLALGWERMCAYWDDPAVIEQCAKKSQNRLQGPRMTHGQGSRCQQDVRAKMKEQAGGVEPAELHVMSRTKSRKGGGIDEEWRPLIDQITEKTIELHGREPGDWPTGPTPATHPPPTNRHRLVGHSGEAPELYGFQSHKKAYVPHAVNVTHYSQAPAPAPSAAQQAQDKFNQQLMYEMLAGLPNYKQKYTALYQLNFGRLPDHIPGLDEAGPANALYQQ